jgi:23S rRNA pseudouridine2605 synthase
VNERLQKVLAGAGVASRREAEGWITAGRVTVNGRPAVLGQRVGADDVIAIDGRRLRLERAAPEDLVLIYHRSPGEALKAATAAEGEVGTTTYERLPKLRGRRWLPLSPLAPTDGGLEVFTTDGALRAQASRLAHELVSTYSVRIAGEPAPELLEDLKVRALAAEPPFEIVAAAIGGGEGRNRWLDFEVRHAHGRDLRNLLLASGFEVSRVLRTRFGPVTLDRGVLRGRSRELSPEERDAVYTAVGLPTPAAKARKLRAGSRSDRPSRPATRGRAARGRSAGPRPGS